MSGTWATAWIVRSRVAVSRVSAMRARSGLPYGRRKPPDSAANPASHATAAALPVPGEWDVAVPTSYPAAIVVTSRYRSGSMAYVTPGSWAWRTSVSKRPVSSPARWSSASRPFARYEGAEVSITTELVAAREAGVPMVTKVRALSLIHISEPTRLGMISYAVFC